MKVFPPQGAGSARGRCRTALFFVLLNASAAFGFAPQESSDQLALKMLSILSNYRAGNVKEAALAWQHLAQDTLLIAKDSEKDSRRLAGVSFVLASIAWQDLADSRSFHAWQAGLETFLALGLLWDELVAEQINRLSAISQTLVSADLVSGALPSTPIKLDAEGLLWSELEKRLTISSYRGPETLRETTVQAPPETPAFGRFPAPIPLDLSEDAPEQAVQASPPAADSFGEAIVQERGFREDDRVTPALESQPPAVDPPGTAAGDKDSPYSQTSPAFLQALAEEFGESEELDEASPEAEATNSPATAPSATISEPTPTEQIEAEPAPLIDTNPADKLEETPEDAPGAAAVEAVPSTAPVQRDIFQAPVLGGTSFVEPTWRRGSELQRQLTKAEIKAAQTAWAYVVRNTQPQTGLVNSVEGYPFASVWDIASGLAALLCAGELGLLSRQDFTSRLDTLLTTFEALKLYRDTLPNREYRTDNAQMTDLQNQESEVGSGWSALDVGRLLIWLAVCREWVPTQARRVDAIVRSWNLEAACQRGQLFGAFYDGQEEVLLQEGRLGYEQYAAGGFAAWNAPVTVAENLTFDRWVEVEGLTLPIDSRNLNFLTSEPFYLTLMELARQTPEFRRLSALMYEVQKRRWQRTAILTAVSEDTIARYPWFVYNCIVFGAEPWRCVDRNGFARDGLKSFSTKAGWAWSTLFLDGYAEQLLNKAQALHQPGMGFYSGEFESGVPNESFNISTNAVVLESLCALTRGAVPFLQGKEAP